MVQFPLRADAQITVSAEVGVIVLGIISLAGKTWQRAVI